MLLHEWVFYAKQKINLENGINIKHISLRKIGHKDDYVVDIRKALCILQLNEVSFEEKKSFELAYFGSTLKEKTH